MHFFFSFLSLPLLSTFLSQLSPPSLPSSNITIIIIIIITHAASQSRGQHASGPSPPLNSGAAALPTRPTKDHLEAPKASAAGQREEGREEEEGDGDGDEEAAAFSVSVSAAAAAAAAAASATACSLASSSAAEAASSRTVVPAKELAASSQP